MARLRRHTSLRRGEDGSTLVELLVVSTMLISVIGAILGLNRVAFKEQARIEGGIRGIISQKNGLERMSRELRQADLVCAPYPTCAPFTNASTVDFRRCQGGGASGCTQYWVRYNCSGTPAQSVPPALTTRACLRSEASTPDQLGVNQRILLRNVDSAAPGPFSLAGTSYVSVSMRVVAKGMKHAIAFQDGVRIRNVNEVADSGETG